MEPIPPAVEAWCLNQGLPGKFWLFFNWQERRHTEGLQLATLQYKTKSKKEKKKKRRILAICTTTFLFRTQSLPNPQVGAKDSQLKRRW